MNSHELKISPSWFLAALKVLRTSSKVCTPRKARLTAAGRGGQFMATYGKTKVTTDVQCNTVQYLDMLQ